MMDKQQMIEEINKFLLIDSLSWDCLPTEDIEKLYMALVRFKTECEEILNLLNEITTQVQVVSEDNGEWRHYTT